MNEKHVRCEQFSEYSEKLHQRLDELLNVEKNTNICITGGKSSEEMLENLEQLLVAVKDEIEVKKKEKALMNEADVFFKAMEDPVRMTISEFVKKYGNDESLKKNISVVEALCIAISLELDPDISQHLKPDGCDSFAVPILKMVMDVM